MRKLLTLACTLGLAAVAHGAQTPLFAVADVAAPSTELPAWSKVIAWLAPGTPTPPPEAIGTVLGQLIGVPSLNGVDPTRPFHLALVNPQTNTKPVVLVVGVKDPKALAASVAGQGLEAHVTRGQAVVGAPSTLAAVEKAVLAATRTAPAHGAHLVAFVPAIDEAFGAQLQQLAAFAQAPSGPMAALGSMGGKVIQLFIDATKQTERLIIDVEARDATPVLTIAVEARAGSPMATMFAAQRPSDFALLSKLPAGTPPVVMAGMLDTRIAGPWMIDWLAGLTDKPDETRAAMTKFMGLVSGRFAGASEMPSGQTPGPSTFLVGVDDASKALALLPESIQLMTRMTMLGGAASIKSKLLPPTRYDGMPVVQSETVTNVKATQGGAKTPRSIAQHNAWSGFGPLLVGTSGLNALTQLKRAVDAARGKTPSLALDAITQAAVERARAAGDSIWMRVSLPGMAAASAAPAPSTPNALLDFGIGFTPSTLRLRLALDRAH